MKCEECLQLIEIFFDGELDKQTANEISLHIAECSSCADVCRSLQNEQEFFSSAISGVEVSPYFWVKVDEKIKAERTNNPFRRFVNSLASFNLQSFNPLPLAALCLFVVAISAGAIWMIHNSENNPSANYVAKALEMGLPEIKINKETVEKETPKNKLPNTVRPSKVVASNSRKKNIENDVQPTDNIAKRAEKKYLEAIALLSRDINKRRQQLDRQTAEQFKKTLAVVDRTIQSTRQAVRENPDDPVAVQYMLSAYAQKIDVLRGLINY